MIVLKNKKMQLLVDDHGAEIKSLKMNDREYVWQGDSKYWGRTSPVLFPIVGALNNKTALFNGKEYHMGQHGFARDMDFETVYSDEKSCCLCLKANKETMDMFPYDFELDIGYEISEDTVKVRWKVVNPSEDKMYFSIGAHPAFNCTYENAFISLYKDDKQLESIDNTIFGTGLLTENHREIPLPAGKLCYEKHTFDGDAFVLENAQADKAELYDKGVKRVEVTFKTPLLGIWAPVGKDAPFMCIEPWYGCADTEGFNGDFSEKKHINCLNARESFEAEYLIKCF